MPKLAAARWVLRIMCNGKRRDIGLGAVACVSLLEARDQAHELRQLTKQGEDPVVAQRALREGVATFEQCARTVHKNRKSTWRNGKHTNQWLKTLELYSSKCAIISQHVPWTEIRPRLLAI